MVLSAILRKSLRDLTRRRARAVFAVATLALAVASIGIFALPSLMNRAMDSVVASDRLPDLTVDTRPLALDRAQLAGLGALPNVRAIEARSFFGGRVFVGNRLAFANVVGVSDFARQQVNVVHVTSGTAPNDGEVLTDAQNARQGLLSVHAGETLRIIGAGAGARGASGNGFRRRRTGRG
jgi:hypothetical protein